MSVESLEFWKNLFEIAGVGLLLFTFIAGAGVLWFSRKLNAVQAEQLRQFDKTLTDTKLELGRQQERAAEADERASKIEAGNIQLRADLETETGKVAILQKDASNAKTAQQRVELEVESQKSKRIELAASLIDRYFSDQSGAIAKLSKFGRMSVVFEFVSEREPRRTAEQINSVFSSLSWPGVRINTDEDFIRDGVTISAGSKFTAPPRDNAQDFFRWSDRKQEQESISKAAAETLRDALLESGIDAEIGNNGYDLDPGTLLIQVGLKPNRALESTLKELGPRPEPTPLKEGLVTFRLAGNRAPIPEQAATPTPSSDKP